MPSRSAIPPNPNPNPNQRKGYVVLEQSFGYDDQYFTREDGGKPLRIFLDRLAADDHRIKLTAQRLREISLRDYMGEGQDVFDYVSKTNPLFKKYSSGDNVYQAIGKIVGETVYHDDGLEMPDSITLTQATQLARLLDKLDLFYVVETDIVESRFVKLPEIDLIDDEATLRMLAARPLRFTFSGAEFEVSSAIYEDNGVIKLPGGDTLVVTGYFKTTPPTIAKVEPVNVELTPDLTVYEATEV